MPTVSKKSKHRSNPHKTFRLTRRRDAVQPLQLPSYLQLTHEVFQTIWKQWRTFGLLVLIVSGVYIALVGMQSQSDYADIASVVKDSGGELLSGVLGTLGQASILLITVASARLSGEMSELQQVFSVFMLLMTWLVTVWLLRQFIAGKKVKLRDGLYNSMAPFVSTVLILLLIAVQLVPVSLAIIAYNAALATGLLAGGVATMLFWLAAALLCILSVYWLTSSLLALVIVTLPGMYPYSAIKTAGTIVLGRRIKLLLRWLWLGFINAVALVLVMMPVILLTMWLTSVWSWVAIVPIVPVILVLYVASAVVWSAAYVYILYRKVVDNAAA